MSDQTFHIGLCMAGAVSAGAYTAGVMDYLTEALAEWEKRRGNAGVPTHKVVISVIGGSSAGGMTGIITGAAVNQPLSPVAVPPPEQLLENRPDNLFYHTWVDLLNDDMFSHMLDQKDIEQNRRVDSLLNADFIDTIADRAISVNPEKRIATPPYFSDQLRLFTTLTNLEGIKYHIGFKSEVSQSNYTMAVHNDYACFTLNAAEYNNDGWMPLNFKNNENVAVARDAAIATGAFPIGLKSRLLTRSREVVLQNPWLNQLQTVNDLSDQSGFITQNVDGGLINNEPFEKVRELLSGITEQYSEAEQNEYDRFKSAVVMVDPFPSESSDTFSINQQLFPSLGYTLHAVTQQMRAKPVSLADAMSAEKAGQFLIAPTRPVLSGRDPGKKVEGSKAIACGAFDGFAGFMHKEFRIHDYFLGRYNCEMFLRNYFTVPAEHLHHHPVFSKGYEGIDHVSFKSFHTNSIQIIPVFNTYRQGYFPMPVFTSGTQWPSVKITMPNRYKPAIQKRVNALLMHAVPLNAFLKFLIFVSARLFLNRWLAQKITGKISDALKQHDLVTKIPAGTSVGEVQ